MNNVIKVDFIKTTQLNASTKVSLRDVWNELKSERQFGNWVAYYLPNLVENQDYGVLNKSVKNTKAGRPTKDYWITVDAAKSLAMMQNTETGKAVRKYFLECESLVYSHGLEGKLTNIPQIVSAEFLRKIADTLEAETARADKAEAKLAKSQASAVDFACQHGLLAHQVMKLYPEKSAELIESVRTNMAGVSKYSDTGLLTIGLKSLGVVASLIKITKNGNAKLFNKATVDEVFK